MQRENTVHDALFWGQFHASTLKCHISYYLYVQEYTFRGITNYSCILFTILWTEKRNINSKLTVFFTIPYIHKMQENCNLGYTPFIHNWFAFLDLW